MLGAILELVFYYAYGLIQHFFFEDVQHYICLAGISGQILVDLILILK